MLNALRFKNNLFSRSYKYQLLFVNSGTMNMSIYIWSYTYLS